MSLTPFNSTNRIARLYRKAKSAMQSGTGNTMHWELVFDTQQKWENPLMGWASTADPMHSMVLKFDSKESALRYAQNMNYTVQVQEPEKYEEQKPNSYAKNFEYSKSKLRFHFTK